MGERLCGGCAEDCPLRAHSELRSKRATVRMSERGVRGLAAASSGIAGGFDDPWVMIRREFTVSRLLPHGESAHDAGAGLFLRFGGQAGASRIGHVLLELRV